MSRWKHAALAVGLSELLITSSLHLQLVFEACHTEGGWTAGLLHCLEWTMLSAGRATASLLMTDQASLTSIRPHQASTQTEELPSWTTTA